MRKLLSAGLLGCFALVACGPLSGIDDFRLGSREAAAVAALGCHVHADCKLAPVGEGGFAADFCLAATQRCVALKSQDCSVVSGPVEDDSAILVGSLFSTTGSQAAVNLGRQQSVMLAVSELNSVGGLPGGDPTVKPRPLVLVSCDESVDSVRAAAHLANDLHISAIVGPNNSQHSLDVAMNVTIQSGTVTVSPTAVAESIAELRDSDLSWQMVPTDVQRGPLLTHQINVLERELRAVLGGDLKLGMIFRDDALGAGTRASLVELVWNGKPLSASGNLGTRVKIDVYDANEPSHDELIASYLAFAPDVLVLVGAGDAISGVMEPLEAGWNGGPRPQYVLIDSSKVPELLRLVVRFPELRERVRGTGVTPSPESLRVQQSFRIAYQARYLDDQQATSSGLGASYDATYALAFAMVAAKSTNGVDIARGLRRLGIGEPFPIGPTNILSAFRRFDAGESIQVIGTSSRLAWDDRGAISAGLIEVWCVDLVAGEPVFTASGLSATIPEQTLRGANNLCGLQPGGKTSTGTAAPPQDSQSTPPAQPAMQPGAAMMPRDAGVDAGHDAGLPADAAVDAGAPDAGVKPTESRRVPCGGTLCERERGEFCCIVTAAESGRGVAEFSCQTSADRCSARLRCASDSQCEHGQICCINQQRESQCRAAASCGGSDLHLACDGPHDCTDGQQCCAHGDDSRALRATSCGDSCNELPGYPNMICDAQSQCPAGDRCVQSFPLPSVGVCL